MTTNTVFQVNEVQISEVREHLSLYKDANLFKNLTVYAVLEPNSQKYLLKIKDEKYSVLFVIRLERSEDGLRVMNLGTIAKNIRKLGFTTFTVLMDGDV